MSSHIFVKTPQGTDKLIHNFYEYTAFRAKWRCLRKGCKGFAKLENGEVRVSSDHTCVQDKARVEANIAKSELRANAGSSQRIVQQQRRRALEVAARRAASSAHLNARPTITAVERIRQLNHTIPSPMISTHGPRIVSVTSTQRPTVRPAAPTPVFTPTVNHPSPTMTNDDGNHQVCEERYRTMERKYYELMSKYVTSLESNTRLHENIHELSSANAALSDELHMWRSGQQQLPQEDVFMPEEVSDESQEAKPDIYVEHSSI